MGFQYKFSIEGKVYDLIPGYPEEQEIDLNVLNRLCYMLRYEQQTNRKAAVATGKVFEDYKGYIEHLLQTRQDEIINAIHKECYPKMLELSSFDREEILFQYLFQNEKLSLTDENFQKIFHFYTLIDSNFRGTLLSPYGAILLGEKKIPTLLARMLCEKQLTKTDELKTHFINGRMLLLMRDEYSKETKQCILETYSDEELAQEQQKFNRFYRGFSLAVALTDTQKNLLEKDVDSNQAAPFYQEYQEATKILPLNTNQQLLLRMAQTSCLLEEEEKRRERAPILPVHKKRLSPSTNQNG